MHLLQVQLLYLKMDKERKRWETKKLLDPKFNHKEQVVKINIGNTFKHELAKFILCWEAAKNGKRFVTEGIFLNGKRADIIILDDEEAWEVLKSETKEQFKSKQKNYPIHVIPFQADDVLKFLEKFLEGK